VSSIFQLIVFWCSVIRFSVILCSVIWCLVIRCSVFGHSVYGHSALGLSAFCHVPDTASYIRGWIQMVLAPNDLFSWNNKYSKYMNIYIARTFTFIFLLSTTTHSVHAGISKLWRGRLPRPVVVFSSHRVSRLISSPVQAKLTLLVPASGTGSPFPQNGIPIHRVCAHSLSRVHDMSIDVRSFCVRSFGVWSFGVRCSVIWCTVIRRWAFRHSVSRCSVILRSVFWRSVGESMQRMTHGFG
jgi:hypothetical protein